MSKKNNSLIRERFYNFSSLEKFGTNIKSYSEYSENSIALYSIKSL